MNIPTVKSAIFVMLLAAAVECPPLGEQVQLAGTRDQAETECKQREGRGLPSSQWLPDGHVMLSRDVPTLWLSPRLHVMDEPEWIDGHVMEPGENFLGNCGYYVPRDDAVEMTDCNKGPYGFVCNLKGRRDCAMCDNGHPSAQCFRHGGNCYALYYKSQNWYEARAHCQRQGGDLVVLSSKKLKKKIRAQLKANDGTHFWIGLRKEIWSWEIAKTIVPRTHWLPGEPSPKLSCMVAALGNDGRFGWKTSDCSELHRSVCVKGDSKIDAKKGNRDNGSEDKSMTSFQRLDEKMDHVISEMNSFKQITIIVSVSAALVLGLAIAVHQRGKIRGGCAWIRGKLSTFLKGSNGKADGEQENDVEENGEKEHLVENQQAHGGGQEHVAEVNEENENLGKIQQAQGGGQANVAEGNEENENLGKNQQAQNGVSGGQQEEFVNLKKK